MKLPSRYLAYMAGKSTALYLGAVQQLLARWGDSIDVVHFIIGDLPSYQWVKTQALDQRIRLIYQHENIDPFQGRSFDPAHLGVLEERYGAPNLWRYINVQRAIDRMNERAKLSYLCTYLEYFDRIWSELQPEVLITGCPDSLPFLVVKEVCVRNGGIPLLLIGSRLPGRFNIVDSEMERIPYLTKSYEILKSRALTLEEQNLADSVRRGYLERKTRPPHYKIGPWVRTFPSPLELVRTVWKRVRWQDRYFNVPFVDDLYNSFIVRARWAFHAWDIRRLSKSSAEGKFFYFPLNYEPEVYIDVLGSVWTNQMQVIQLVSSMLPVGYKLYVKEHPNMFAGKRPLGFYRCLAKLGNTELLDSEANSFEIIERCHGVITIAGTSGFEALFFGKPVLIFGKAFYDVFDQGITRAECYEQMAEALQEMTSYKGFDPGYLDRFVVALYQRTYAGFCHLGEENETNCAALADGLMAELKVRLAHSEIQ